MNHIKYDPEADVLSWKINKLYYDDARDYGDLIVHISPLKIPTYFELLNASDHFNFLKKRREKFLLDGAGA